MIKRTVYNLNLYRFFNRKLQYLLFVILIFAFNHISFGQSQTINTPGTGTVTIPAGVTSVTVEVWGGGGKGGSVTANNTQAGGGGGGAYSRSVLTVTATTYNYSVGAGSTTTSAGGDTWFNTATTLMAKGGNSVANNNLAGATGGARASGFGTTLYSGGNGANGVGGSTKQGGGGGSSAGTASDGTTATNITGAIAPAGGGNGGNGADEGASGTNGSTPGGGGGGAARKNAGTTDGGNGANGKLVINWTCPTYSLNSTVADDACTSAGTTTVTITSSAANLPVGTYTVTYSRSLPSASGLSASMTVSSAGTGTFTASGLSAAGNCTITVTNLASGNITTCSNAVSANNTADIYVSSAIPSQPSSITGNTTPCNGSTQIYSVTAVDGVSYAWTFPSGWSQTGGGTTNSITVTTNGNSGNVQVTPSNACGTGTAQTLAVTATDVPAQPSAITGSTTPCEGSSQIYSVTNVAGVTYTWSFPSGWSQTGGGTSNSITVTPSATSGNVQVTPSNSCGDGIAQTLAVTPSPLPDAAGTISGSPTVNQNETGVAYSVGAITNASSYTWSYTGSGATINGSTNSITIDFSGTATSGILTVKGTNSCGDGVVSADYPITVAGGLPTVAFTTSSQSSTDETGTMTITAELSAVSASDVTIPFTIDGGSTATGSGVDYTYSPNSPDELVITAGNTTADLTITIATDAIDENNETIIVNMGTPTNADQGAIIIHTATITDDDATPTVTFTSASQASGVESGTMTITAQLSAVSGLDVTIPFSVNGSSTAIGGGTDYSITASPITITAGNLTSEITITITDENVDEDDETVIVDMGSPTNATQGATTQHTATITDDDTDPKVSFTSSSQSSVGESGTMTITVGLNIVLGVDVTIPFSINGGSTAADPADYSITSSPVVITAGNTSVDITITIATDALDEENETIIVDMGTPTNAGLGTTTQHTATITDDDATPTVTFISGSQASPDETDASTMTITAELSAASSFDVDIPFTINVSSTATGGGTDYTITSSPITITAGNTSATITISIVGDATQEGDETIIVDMGTPTHANQGATTTHTATITDDDFPAQSLSVSPSNICIGDQVTFTASVSGIACSDIVRYEESIDGGSNWSTVIATPGTTCSENYTPITTGSLLYRYYYYKNGPNSGYSNNVAVTVNSLPTPSFTVEPGASACVGVDVTYTTEASMSSYVWNFPGTVDVDYSITSGGTSTDYTVTLKYLTTGSKTLTISYTNGNGCTAASPTSSTATTVYALPTPSFTVEPGASVCINEDVTYTTQVSMSSYEWVIPGVLNTDYSITSGGTSSDNSVTLKYLTTGSKTVTINYTNSNGCTAETATSSTATTVNALPTPTFIAEPGATACIDEDLTYTTQASMSSYAWVFPGVLNTDYSITSGGTSSDNTVTLKYLTIGSKTVTINYTDGNGCTAVSATSSTATTVNGLPSSGLSVADGQNCNPASGNVGIVVTSAESGVDYELKTLGGASLSPTVTGSGPAAFLTLTVLEANVPTATTTYKVVATKTSTGCAVDLTDQPTITITDAPSAALAVSDASTCNPATGDITITITNAENGVDYELQTTGGASLSPAVTGTGTGGNLDLTILQANAPTSTTTYKVVASVGGGCANVDLTDQPTVTVYTTPVITDLSDQTSCGDYTLPTINGTNLVSAAYYTATLGGGTSYNATDNITISETLYIYSNNNGCYDQDTFDITINRLNVALVDVTGSGSPTTSDGSDNISGSHCPQLDSLFNPENDIYNPGVTELVFRVDRELSTTEWSFDFDITGTNVTVDSLTISYAGTLPTVNYDTPGVYSAGNITMPNDNNYVLLYFTVNNVPGSALSIQLDITTVTDENCSETEVTGDNSGTHELDAMPPVGTFN